MSVTVFPSVSGWITPRTDEVRLTDQNCKILVDKPIDYITKVLLDAGDGDFGSGKKFVDLYMDQTLQVPVFPLNISKYVVEYDKYKTLPTYGINFNFIDKGLAYTNNTWYYTAKTKELILPNTDTLDNGYYVASNVIRSALYDLAMINGRKLYIKKLDGYGRETAEEWRIDGENELYGDKIYNFNLMNARFRIYYEPLGENIRLNTYKQVTVKNEFAIPFSQQQQIVNNMSLGRNMQAMANRTGVETRTICRKVKQIDKIRTLGSYWEDAQGNRWRLTANNIDFSCGYANCTETWSKNWAMQSEFVGINREFRSWKIPADTVRRNLLIEDYCYLTESAGFSGADARLTSTGKYCILQSFNTKLSGVQNVEATQIEIINKNTAGGIVGSCVTTTTAFGFGNSLVISATTKDNLSVGTQRSKSSDDGSSNNKRFCRDVYYANPNGTMGAVGIKIGHTLTNLDTDMYPQSKSVRNGDSENANVVDGIVVDVPYIALDKDESEQLSFTYQLHFLSHLKDVVIGAGLCQNLLLAKSRDGSNFKFWYITKKLPQSLQTINENYGQDITTLVDVSPTTQIGDNFITLREWACITDSNNNIIIANNSSALKTIYFNFTSNYNAMQEYYESEYGSQYRDAIAQN